MKKKTRKTPPKRTHSQPDPAPAAQKAKAHSRRNVLRLMRNAAIAVPILGIAGYLVMDSVQASAAEADLSKIGGGKLSVVQIHDPQCPLCRTLQKQTRKALKSFEEDEFTFLVANIKTPRGAEFAAQYGVPHVTLLLFDRRGEMVEIVRGPIASDALQNVLQAHAAAHG
ncbi:thioredoxin family protein [Litoreibacter albidus]|uniref:Thioredoxin n=1 Tax=Litoreibacter albidus TaxID=670155 RepID=A0A1H2SX81_9RHOB|nr:thioredoxin family protein [Litoreibacter albidus]SDW36127.1 Thioredoxin [Litoreibacter albidus]